MGGIQEVAGRLTGAPVGRRFMAMLWFYCDESYDNPLKNYCVAGLLGEEKTFVKLEANWIGINKRFGVQRFHAAPLNAFDHEYEGWEKNRQIQYTKRLLKAIQRRGADLQLTAIGLEADAYEEELSSDAKIRLGNPYTFCFKQCLLMLSIMMRQLPPEYRFSVIFERNEHETEAVRVFYMLKYLDPEIGQRMGTCTPGSWSEQIALQPADLIAYESMRLMKTKRSNGKMRLALQSFFGVSGSAGFYFDRSTMDQSLKDTLEKSQCIPGGYFFTERKFYPEYRDGDSWEELERKVNANDGQRPVRRSNAERAFRLKETMQRGRK